MHAVTAVGNGGTPYYSAAYDAAGEMTCRALNAYTCDIPTPSGQSLTYDALRRLASWQGASSSESYVYDGEGNRVWRQTTSGATTTTLVSILGVEDVTAVSGGATTATRYYALPGGVTATRDGSGLVYEASDALGTPIAALNLSSGITGEQLRAPYGQARYGASASGSGGGMRTPFGFTGQREDTAPSGASGLDDFNARYYDAATGRFTSADDAQPGLGDPSGQDNYAYVGGMVENAEDPSGHKTCIEEICLTGAPPSTESSEDRRDDGGGMGGAIGIAIVIVSFGIAIVKGAISLVSPAPTTSTRELRPLAPANTGSVPSPGRCRHRVGAVTGSVINRWIDPIHAGTLNSSLEPPPEPTTTPTTQTGGSGGGQPPHIVVSSCGCEPLEPNVLRHYTTKKGFEQIISSERLKVSTQAANPKDARYGDGVYLTDLIPGAGLTRGQLAYRLWNTPKAWGKTLYYVDVDVTGLGATEVSPHNFLISSSAEYLDISGRIVDSGETPWC